MAQSSVQDNQDSASNENSVSTKEFLTFEKVCESYKDSDDEIKHIFNEINKLAAGNSTEKVISEDVDDVELILKRAEDIAQETENLLKSSPVVEKLLKNSPVVAETSLKNSPATSITTVVPNMVESSAIPQIKVTKPDVEDKGLGSINKVNQNVKQNGKENFDIRRKPKPRPFSAGVIDSRNKRESTKNAKSNTTPLHQSPKKTNNKCAYESVVEELKDTNERAKSLELHNVQLVDDNKALRKKLEQIIEDKHVADLKLAECEKFVSRLCKEYENRNTELKTIKENENRLIAEVTKERNDKKNLTVQHDKDLITIQDLQRQVKEMEMILKRKHPDSVSALIVASKSSTMEDNKKKLLEERIARLEQELKDKEDHFQGILLTLQEKFCEMKQKYESHIIDVERQLMEDKKVNNELKNKIMKSNLVDAAVQTVPKSQHTVSSQTFIKPDRASSAVSRLSQNSALLLNKLKEDSYLVATIKGLQSELTVKQRTIAKINRETEELRKNLRSLQKEKEVLLNLNPHKKIGNKSKSTENLLSRMNIEMEAELLELKQQKECLIQERNSLLDSLKRTNEEFILLKKKRIQDLHTLQLSHEKELMQMNMQVYPLQEEIKALNRTVEHLQEKVRNPEDKYSRYQKDNDVHAGGDHPGVKRSVR